MFFFQNYSGNNEYDSCSKFVETQFKNLIHSKDRALYVHFTCATDAQSVKFVFTAFQDIFLSQKLESLSLT